MTVDVTQELLLVKNQLLIYQFSARLLSCSLELQRHLILLSKYLIGFSGIDCGQDSHKEKAPDEKALTKNPTRSLQEPRVLAFGGIRYIAAHLSVSAIAAS